MNSERRADHAAPDTIWRALADPTRRALLDQLRAGRRSTGGLVDVFPHLSRFAVMKHLTVLEGANLIVVRRDGRTRWNHLNAVPLREMYERWVSRLDDGWAVSLLDIGRLAEATHATSGDAQMEKFQTIDIHQEHRIAAPPDVVFTILTTRIGDWWREPYRLGGGGSEIRLDPSPGGTLAEHWGDGEFAVWGTVTRYQPNRIVAFAGACGLGGGVNGEFSFAVEPDGAGTLLRLVHIASGLIDDSTRAGYDTGWATMADWLKEVAEQQPTAIAAS